MNMKKGEIIKIYEDPVTETKVEGVGKLLKKIQPDTKMAEKLWETSPFTLERWLVEFSDGSRVHRWVKKVK